MAKMQVEKIYNKYIKKASGKEKLKLISLISNNLAEAISEEGNYSHNLLELDGLGKEIWQGIDVERYVNNLRDEWNN